MNLTDNLNSKELRLNYNNDGFSRASALRPLIQITFEETTFSKVLFTAAMVLLRSPCVSANKIRRTQAAADCNCCQDKEWRKQIWISHSGFGKNICLMNCLKTQETPTDALNMESSWSEITNPKARLRSFLTPSPRLPAPRQRVIQNYKNFSPPLLPHKHSIRK